MNNEDMSELFSKFSNMVNEGNIPEEMKNILSSLSGNQNENTNTNTNRTEQNNQTENETPSIDFETIMKMKSIMDKMKGSANDPRANLLLSLKPYLKESRKEKIDQYIKLFSMSKVMEVFNNSGGEFKK
ncbi:MAG: hypothetical protein HFJ50_03865 [Clostridia bacterium]|jgi:hypothetical protein|nr:hypothetical protein [Clostridia bacterium]